MNSSSPNQTNPGAAPEPAADPIQAKLPTGQNDTQLRLEERLSRLTATVPGAIYAFRLRPDGSSCFAYASPQLNDVAGIEPEELVDDASPAFALVHPEDLPMLNATILEAARTMTLWTYTFRVRHPRKGLVWIEGRSTPQLEEDGCILWHGFLLDVTERKRAETLADGQRQVLEMIAKGAPLPATLDKLLRTFEAQSEEMYCSILLLDAEGKHLRHGAAPRLPAEYTRAIDGVAIGPGVGSCGTAAFLGEPVYVRDIATDPLWAGYRDIALAHGLRACWSTPIFDTERLVLGTFAIYYSQPNWPREQHVRMVDIATHTAAIAISRHRSEAALRFTQERFAQLAENIREVFWMTDIKKNQMLYVSPAYEKIWGRTCASLYQSPRAWLEAIHPADRERVQHAALTKQRVGEYNEEYRIIQPDGSMRWIHDQAFPIRDAKGEVYRIAGVAEDITEHKRIEEQFLQSQKMEAVGQLAGGVAHDFNNLLTVIQSSAALLADPETQPGSAEAADLVQQIHEAARRAASLTRQLLLFSRKQIMQPANLDLNEIAVNMTKMLQRILGEDIALQCSYAPQLPLIHADAGMVEQVLLNLAVNSRDAMPGGGRLLVATRSGTLDEKQVQQHPDAVPGTYVSLQVTDTGCGIAAEHLRRIFEPFYTTKEVGKGTGLGLATVYGIVKQHRGWITVASEINHGTTFQIYFPALSGVEKLPTNAAAACDLLRGTECILVVEDEPALRTLVGSLLERCGYRVLRANSGVEALVVWNRHRDEIELLLTDIIMPDGMSGHELAAQLKGERPDLKVIFTSGYNPEFAGKETHLIEGVNFISKPYAPQKLTQTVRECLDRK